MVKIQVLLINVRYFPKGLFSSGSLPRIFFYVTTFQMYNFPSGNFPNLPQPQRLAHLPVIVPLSHPSRSTRHHCSLQSLSRPNLTLGSLPWENPFMKVPTTLISILSIDGSPSHLNLWINIFLLITLTPSIERSSHQHLSSNFKMPTLDSEIKC